MYVGEGGGGRDGREKKKTGEQENERVMPTSLRVAQDSGCYDMATLIKQMFQIQLCHALWQSTNVQVGPLDAFTTRPCNGNLQADRALEQK